MFFPIFSTFLLYSITLEKDQRTTELETCNTNFNHQQNLTQSNQHMLVHIHIRREKWKSIASIFF